MSDEVKYKNSFKCFAVKIFPLVFLASTVACEKSPEKVGLKDIYGNVYETIEIGTRIWMAENLRTTRLNDGTEIPLIESGTAWSNLESPGYCWYGNYKAFFCLNHFGALYNFHAVKTGKLCPAGWHVPSTDEWNTMIENLGYESAGGKMKETGTRNWLPPNTEANNETGFTALPGGFRNAYYKDFEHFRISGNFWHSEFPEASRVIYNESNVTSGAMNWNDGLSVRCIKN